MHQFFTSATFPAAGPKCLQVGDDARRLSLDSALWHAEQCRPEILVVSLAGHGAIEGVLLYDGVYDYRRLVERIRRVEARWSLVLVDACAAGRLPRLAGIPEVGAPPHATPERAFADLLACSTPGMRVIVATRENETTREGRLHPDHGDFTAAMLLSLDNGPADMLCDGYAFLSDGKAVDVATRILRAELPGSPLPYVVEHRSRSAMPIALSERTARIGSGQVCNLRVLPDALYVRVHLDARHGLRTRMRATVSTELGWSESYECDLVAQTSNSECTVEVPLRNLLGDELHNVLAESGLQIGIGCLVELLDRFGRPLTRVSYDACATVAA